MTYIALIASALCIYLGVKLYLSNARNDGKLLGFLNCPECHTKYLKRTKLKRSKNDE